MPEERIEVIVGVDTHADTHAAVAIDHHGRRLDSIEIEATLAGYRHLLAWAGTLGALSCVGVEGTGSYGVGLSRFLTAAGVQVVEVGRVNRQHRRRYGKSTPLMRRPRHAPCSRVEQRVSPSRVTGSSNRSVSCMS